MTEVIRKVLPLTAVVLFLAPSICLGQPQAYAGVLGGVSTLSADARTVFSSNGAAASSYGPENGATVDLFGGVHWNDYFSIQLDYLWNRNALTLDAVRSTAPSDERSFSSHQHAVSGNALLYFRPRDSKVRPYLSVGAGAVHLSAQSASGSVMNGFGATKPTLQVAVGIDLRIRKAWAFRYSFSETVSGNPISAQLTPSGTRMLMNFRNLFGIVKTF
ncbi:MAG: outer membrane beta-barrel protein [Candidatus Solibacter sp.]